MKSYDPKDKYDVEEAERLGAPKWMLDLLQMNPGYTGWGPGDDYMKGPGEPGKHAGWDAAVVSDTWGNFCFRNQDDLNVVANFYFEAIRDSETCRTCGGNGYHPSAQYVEDSFYGSRGSGWSADITMDELQALQDAGRCGKWNPDSKKWEKQKVTQELLDEVNRSNQRVGMGTYCHDSINRSILIRTRCERLGLPVTCDHCMGHGSVFTSPEPHLELVLWILHPRKGCSRGVVVKNILPMEVPEVFKYLREARTLMMERFGKIPGVEETP